MHVMQNGARETSTKQDNPGTDREETVLQKSKLQEPINRRGMLQSTAALLGTAVVSGPLVTAIAQAATRKGEVNQSKPNHKSAVIASDETAIAETATGKVRGYIRDGIFTYKGIPYGETTTGSGRFQPPREAKPWTGVRSSMQYGRVCPQGPRGTWDEDEESWLFCYDDGVQGENCLRVNIWTPAINDHKKRPVMVWLHGGGFVSGSSQEHRAYDGERLSRRGDVVVVSLNHRLGPLGFLNLAPYGEQYASSAHLGMLDIIMALEWVRDNISNFGGDPSNVTIFGQSGGGGKVGALMAMPAAQGLFHRAIVQSGSFLRAVVPERSAILTKAMLDELNLSPSQLDQLQDVALPKLIAAGDAALQKTHPNAPLVWSRVADMLGWGPVVDGKLLPCHPFDPTAPAISAHVPMLIGTTLNEFTTSLNHPELELMTETEVKRRLNNLYDNNAEHIIEVFRAAYPGSKPFDIFSLAMTAQVRQGAVIQAVLKAAQGTPAYLYWFTWKTPVLDGRPRALHCIDLPFCFDNTDRNENLTGGGRGPRPLAANVSEAWIHFARTGNPNHDGLPHWPAFSPESCPTMVFNTPCEMQNNPDKKERQVLEMTSPFLRFKS
jgi:para-nitrobenzyl esterase